MNKNQFQSIIKEEIQRYLTEREFLRKLTPYHDSVQQAIQATLNALSFSPSGWIVDPKRDSIIQIENGENIPIDNINNISIPDTASFFYHLYDPKSQQSVSSKLYIDITKESSDTDFPNINRYEVTARID